MTDKTEGKTTALTHDVPQSNQKVTRKVPTTVAGAPKLL